MVIASIVAERGIKVPSLLDILLQRVHVVTITVAVRSFAALIVIVSTEEYVHTCNLS